MYIFFYLILSSFGFYHHSYFIFCHIRHLYDHNVNLLYEEIEYNHGNEVLFVLYFSIYCDLLHISVH